MMENRILQICSDYPWTTLYNKFFYSLEKRGVEEDVYAFINNKSIIENENEYPSNVIISRCFTYSDRLIFHIKHLKVLKDIQEKMSIPKYGMVHAHSLFSNGYIAMKLKKKYGIPYIVAVRNTDVNLFFEKMIFLRRTGINILKKANQVIFLSESYKEQTIKKYVPKSMQDIIYEKALIIPNGIDKFWLDNTGSPKRFYRLQELRLLQVGDIDRNKNIETTVKSIDILINMGYNVKLSVVGNIKDQEVFDKIKNLDYVNYLGYKSKEELIDIYRNNDIFVLPSVTETFGLVYAEAMSQGLPIIYSRGQGFDRQFEDGEVGYSADCMNPNEIATKIITIINNYKNISINCKKLCRKFDWDMIAIEYCKIYFAVLE